MKIKLMMDSVIIASSLSASVGFLTGSTIDGMKKICYYSTAQGTMAITIESYQLCPVNMKF
jgi:hypothetical protein